MFHGSILFMLRSISVVVSLVGVLAVTGCSSDDDRATTSDSSPGPSRSESSEPSEPCGLLTDEQVTAVAGEALGEPIDTQVAGQFPGCLWGAPDEVGVQAASVPAGEWARELPELVEQLMATGGIRDADNLRKLEDAARLIESGDTIAPSEACRLFSELLAVAGPGEGLDLTVNIFPTKADPQAITGQACVDGTFASVVLVRQDLTGSPEEIDRVQTATNAVVSRRSR